MVLTHLNVKFGVISIKINCKARLQQCGSASEKSMLWKSRRRCGKENKFIEFDYLAVLENRNNSINIAEGDCPDCRMVEVSDGNTYLQWALFKHDYQHTLYDKTESLCSFTMDDYVLTSLESLINHGNSCQKCTAIRNTGCLKIIKPSSIYHRDIGESEECSLAFYRFSFTDSLLATNSTNLQLTEQIQRLVIRTDVMPAFEIDGDQFGIKRFVVPKEY